MAPSTRSLFEHREALKNEVVGLLNAHPDPMPDEVQRRCTEIKAEADALERRISMQVFADDLERRTQGEPVTGSADASYDRELRSFSLVRAIASQVPGLNVLNTSGIGNIGLGTNGGSLTLDAVIDLIGSVEDARAGNGSMGFVSNRKVKRAVLKLKDSTGLPVGADVIFQGVSQAYADVVPSNLSKGSGTNLSALIYGNWSDLLIGYWSSFDLLVNPYEGVAYSKGNVQVRGMVTMDCAVRHAESFAVIRDVIA